MFIDPREVIAVEAERNYVVLHQPGASHLMRESIARMAARLDRYGFIRIHRSVVVNASCVEEIRRWPTGEYVLKVRGGKEYTVTRTFRRNLKCLTTKDTKVQTGDSPSHPLISDCLPGQRQF
jgi:two-component system, LytTR family, response regulator